MYPSYIHHIIHRISIIYPSYYPSYIHHISIIYQSYIHHISIILSIVYPSYIHHIIHRISIIYPSYYPSYTHHIIHHISIIHIYLFHISFKVILVRGSRCRARSQCQVRDLRGVPSSSPSSLLVGGLNMGQIQVNI